MSKFGILAGAAILAAGVTLSAPASAGTGCNGVINPFVWGCAPWDNNNGAQYPYYRKTQVQIPKANAKVEIVNGARMVTDLRTGQRMPLIQDGGAYMVAAGGMN